jgi:hypothetical protein
MPNVFMCDYRGSSVTTYCVNSSTVNQLGGDLHREVSTGDGDVFAIDSSPASAFRGFSNLAVTFHGKVYRWHSQRIYQYDADAYYVPVGSYSSTQAAFHAFSAGDTWSTDGGVTTGTFAEDGVSTDGFIIVKFTTGSPNINNTDVIEITSGTANGETATATADAAQGGSAGYEGEWKTVYSLSSTLVSGLAISGLHLGPVLGVTKMVGVFLDNSATPQYGSIIYDGGTDSWTEETSLGAAPTSNSSEIGFCTVSGGNLIGFVEGDSTGNNTYRRSTFIYSLNTSTISSALINAHEDFWTASQGQYRIIRPSLVEWKGNLYSAISSYRATPSLETKLDVVKLSAGSWASAWSATSSSTTVYPNTALSGYLYDFWNGIRLWVQDEVMYMLSPGYNLISGVITQRGWFLNRLIDISGTITSDTITNFGNADCSKFSTDMLPSSLAITTATLDNAGENRWSVLKDIETSDPAQYSTSTLLWFTADVDSGGSDLYTFSGVTELTDVTYTWPGGGTPASATVTLSGAITSIVQDDWIGMPGDNGQLFRVTAVNSPTDLTVENPHGLTIPSGTGALIVYHNGSATPSLVSGGTVSGVAEMAKSESMNYGGAEYTFTPGDKDLVIERVSSGVNNQTIYWRAYGGGTVSIDFFFSGTDKGEVDSVATLVSPSTGSLSGTTITGVTADGSLQSVEWDNITDGAGLGTFRTILGKIT